MWRVLLETYVEEVGIVLGKLFRRLKSRAGRFARAVVALARPVQIIHMNRSNAVSEVLSYLEDALSLSGMSGLAAKSEKIKQSKALQLALGWEEADAANRQGNYPLSVRLRKELLEEAYGLAGFEVTTHFPPALGPYYGSAMGHLGMLGHFVLAQREGLLPDGRRTLFHHRVANFEVFRSLSEHFESVRLPRDGWPLGRLAGRVRGNSLNAVTLQPNLWPLLEDITIVKTTEGFRDYYDLAEETIQKAGGISRVNAPFRLQASYKKHSEQRLSELGLPAKQPFVSLHIRGGGPADFRRSSPPRDYLDTIRALVKRGYYVVRFGDRSVDKLPSEKGLVDLVGAIPGDSALDFYVISQSVFLMANQSGPNETARYGGVPVMLSNATAIGRNSLSAAAGSVFLPKRYRDSSGREIPLSGILGSALGYAETLAAPGLAGVREVLNTSDEIRLSSLEVLDKIEGSRATDPVLVEKVSSIRDELGAVSKGHFSEEFLSRNPEWLR